MMRAPDFWQNRSPLALLLAPLGWLYGGSVALRAALANPAQARARVLCVGNLTAGGSGKTPVALALGAALMARGKTIAFLTRGYGGSLAGPVMVSPNDDAARVGDEALLLANIAPTILAADRAVGARLTDADVIVMDDGHQNFMLAKTLSVVVVDGETGFGNGLMIPAGPLREPVAQGLARADAVVIMGGGDVALGDFRGPVLRANLTADGEAFRGMRVFAFAGIGRPQKFIASLEQAGAIVTGSRFFPDHHPYSLGDLDCLIKQAGGAQLVTTQKDFVRLAPHQRSGIAVLSVRAVFDDPAQVSALLDRLA